jgi:hypothetical protein
MSYVEFIASLASIEHWACDWSMEDLLKQVDRTVAKYGTPLTVRVEDTFADEWGRRVMLFEYADTFVSVGYDGEYTFCWVFPK